MNWELNILRNEELRVYACHVALLVQFRWAGHIVRMWEKNAYRIFVVYTSREAATCKTGQETAG
jgi:hypothetical protein